MPFVEITGKVKNGRSLSRGIGFPTINIAVPKTVNQNNFGIWFSLVTIDGKIYPGVTHLGQPKTFKIKHPTCETYLLNLNQDLYGRTVKKKLILKFRDIIDFPDVKALRREIQNDVKEAKKFFGI